MPVRFRHMAAASGWRYAVRENAGRNGQVQEGIEIIVDDDGPGIPAHAFERIFERFYTDRPDQGFGQNSGLGLSISRQIVEAYGGTIRALNRVEFDRAPEIRGGIRRWPAAHRRGERRQPRRSGRIALRRLAAGSTLRMMKPDASSAPHPPVPSAVHATAVAIGETGVLIRGVSGAGKSKLALAMLAEAGRKGLFARLICDDRVRLSLSGGRLLAHAHPAIAGRVEQRGEGILGVAHEASAVVRAVVDLVDPRTGRPPGCRTGEKTSRDRRHFAASSSLCRDRPASEAAQRILAFLGNA